MDYDKLKLKSKIYWRNFMRWARYSKSAKFILYWLAAYLPLAAFYFSEIIHEANYRETFVSDMKLPLAMHAFTALIIAAVAFKVKYVRSVGAKMVVAIVLALLIVNYDSRLQLLLPPLQALMPILPDGNDGIAIVSLLVIVLMGGIAVAAGIGVQTLQKKYASLTDQNIIGALSILVFFLFAGQAMPIAKMYGQLASEGTYQPTAELDQAAKMAPTANATDKPDIYYIVMDRYTNNSVLKNQFSFDNSSFLDSLRGAGFSVTDDATSNYPYTAPSIASVLNMSYHGDDLKAFKDNNVQAATLFHSMIRSSQAIKLLQQQGYKYYNIGSTYGATNKAVNATVDYAWGAKITVFGREKRMRGLEPAQFKQSPYYRFTQISLSWWPTKFVEIDPMPYIRNQITTLDTLANEQPGGRFILAHILSPHEPYYFNADGSRNSDFSNDNLGKTIKQKYIDQIEFMNTQMQEFMAKVDANSGGNAVVLFMSDEGPYPAQLNKTYMRPIDDSQQGDITFVKNMRTWPKKDLDMKYGILQAVRIPKATEQDMQQFTPANAFRIILNRYFGYSYGYLPACQIGFPKGRQDLYVYKDMSELISGASNPACKQYE